MRKDAKKYMNSVIQTIVSKYNMSEIESYRLVKKSFLYDSLLKFSDETIHDDIETNADFVYEDYTSGNLMEM
ncbi:hypothetical protein C823_007659 [Eubacterium plexicaudatum ASF492]|uniref:Uncharacterized protein n=1 Tax=Eubacterium plexicaudatum ASF492 TaxID=1235802 RepID=N1ZZM9_9FIRM|nr:hypothetical protein C823_007659 [Eubacterium plexicaudatum ASF492]